MGLTKYNNLELYYSKNHLAEVNLIKKYHDEVEEKISSLWKLEKPKNVKIYFINSSIEYIRYSFGYYSFLGKLFLIILPCIFLNFIRIWKEAAGVFVNINSNYFIFLKKYDENRSSNIGKYIFHRKYINIEEYLKSIYSHELTHVFSEKLKLPQWLNEGLALYSSEIVLDNKIINGKSLELMDEEKTKVNISNLNLKSEITRAYKYIKGYWTIKYLNEIYPGFLEKTFKEYKGKEVVNQIAKKLGIDRKRKKFNKELDGKVYEYFRNKKN